MVLSIWRNLWPFSAGKKSTSSFTFSLRYCKDIVNMLFWVLWAYLVKHTQSDTINLQKICGYLQAKNQLHFPCFAGVISKICKLILGTLGMHCYTHPKMTVSTCRRLQCLFGCQKYTSFTSFLRYYILKNPAIWFADSILAQQY